VVSRLPDWRERLAAFVAARRETPFAWGAADCCLTSADAVCAMTGVDLAAPLRGYRSQFGACRALVRLGHRRVVSFLDSILPRAQRPLCGDFVAFAAPPLDEVLIADGRGAAWGQRATGLVRMSIGPAPLVWRV